MRCDAAAARGEKILAVTCVRTKEECRGVKLKEEKGRGLSWLGNSAPSVKASSLSIIYEVSKIAKQGIWDDSFIA